MECGRRLSLSESGSKGLSLNRSNSSGIGSFSRTGLLGFGRSNNLRGLRSFSSDSGLYGGRLLFLRTRRDGQRGWLGDGVGRSAPGECSRLRAISGEDSHGDCFSSVVSSLGRLALIRTRRDGQSRRTGDGVSGPTPSESSRLGTVRGVDGGMDSRGFILLTFIRTRSNGESCRTSDSEGLTIPSESRGLGAISGENGLILSDSRVGEDLSGYGRINR